MIVKQYIKEFENLGFGMFVHFGLYSVLGTGEWSKYCHHIPDETYCRLADRFCPKEDWAQALVKSAKNAGCKFTFGTDSHTVKGLDMIKIGNDVCDHLKLTRGDIAPYLAEDGVSN